MTEKRLGLSFAAAFANVDLVRTAIQGVCREHFPAPEHLDAVNDFIIATTEALNNAVEHGTASQVSCDLMIMQQRVGLRLYVVGAEFDSTRSATLPDAEADWLPEGGYGLALIQELSDDLEHTYQNGSNIFTIWKEIPQPVTGEEENGD